jgi:hypothetical protein
MVEGFFPTGRKKPLLVGLGKKTNHTTVANGENAKVPNARSPIAYAKAKPSQTPSIALAPPSSLSKPGQMPSS